MKLSTRIALRYLKSSHQGSFSSYASRLAVIGLGIGIASLLITISIMDGFEQTVSEKIATFDSHVRITQFMDRTIRMPDAKMDSIFQNAPVEFEHSAFIQKPALIRKKQAAEGVIVEGVNWISSDFAIEGEMPFPDKIDLHGQEIWMGTSLADILGIKLGDKIILADLQSFSDPSAKRTMKSFELVGLFHSGLQEYDKTLVFISIPDAQKLFNMRDQISGYKISLNDRKAFALIPYLREKVSYPYYFVTWREKHQVLFDWIDIQKWPILINFGLIALVGIVNIISALAMIIVEKSGQVGILMSQGMTIKHIRKIFRIQGAVIGFAGVILGLFIAGIVILIQVKTQLISLPENIYFMDHIPISIRLMPILILSISVVIISLLASFWPAGKVSQIQPAKVLSYE
ncbi:MAG: ABC transporter permease [Candidatus Marinimicrobia bacterium]|jgi:lipoprotein-releasing system permease protein|nr:ABC transporter permease [Candidatus Neomarinimicrobiota bacterium]MBT3496707.1 ABC transporter permease [Candidatus Neomarinimicrobiota bacterium]MBT3692298.1 ABC transporter permease [Candidatus Neomarinimicrobiota bacterium]MBT3732418.1 ABC transporter permease [Candidatus Neomarinimicrobiota bacterium]MBT4144592.1 ABC transporter permease [Candidatus Neomarinimicrobiota bacterium]